MSSRVKTNSMFIHSWKNPLQIFSLREKLEWNYRVCRRMIRCWEAISWCNRVSVKENSHPDATTIRGLAWTYGKLLLAFSVAKNRKKTCCLTIKVAFSLITLCLRVSIQLCWVCEGMLGSVYRDNLSDAISRGSWPASFVIDECCLCIAHIHPTRSSSNWYIVHKE